MVIVVSGSLSFGGNGTYYGLVYLRNAQSSTGILLSLSGCGKIIGSVMVEGQGGVSVGNCGNQIAFNPGVVAVAGVRQPRPGQEHLARNLIR